ncbi:MAG TPA: hypothetical protein VLJ83_09485 [Gemmatimonadaceae bacterium]|nr:hypothetical protein [Gemmatimonadaceae bacterium]
MMHGMDRSFTWKERRARWALIGAVAQCLVAHGIAAQTPAQASSPLGVWRGTSTCTVHPSACHDEIVVYRITRLGASDSVSMDARKMVNGQEDEMGTFACHPAPSGGQLTCTMPNGVWRFTIRSDSLVGDLRLPNNVKYRDVRTARSH